MEWPKNLESALAAMPAGRQLQIEFSFNLFNPRQKLMYVRCVDPVYPRRRPVNLLPGPVVDESIPDMLRTLARAVEQAAEMATENAESDRTGQPGT